MANPTYSLAKYGMVPGQSTNLQYDIPDTSLDIGTGAQAASTTGGMQGTMARGDQMLVKGPDGSLHWYKYDAERSTPANPVLLFVGP
jgi:hypothetical protein